MRRLAVAILAQTALVGCGSSSIQPQQEVPPAQAQVAPGAAPIASSAEILGEWDVVSFEGYEPARMHDSTRAAYADFTERGVRLRIECNISGANGFVRNGKFVPQPGVRFQTEMGCGPERESRDERYFSFFDKAPTVERLASGMLKLIAGDTVLILERPERRRLANIPERDSLTGSWRMEALTRYESGGGYSGIGLAEVPGRLVIEGNRLTYGPCPQYALTFDFTADGRLAKTGGAEIPEQPDCPALNYPDYDAPALPSAMLIPGLLHSSPWLEKVGPGRILVANERLGLLLVRD